MLDRVLPATLDREASAIVERALRRAALGSLANLPDWCSGPRIAPGSGELAILPPTQHPMGWEPLPSPVEDRTLYCVSVRGSQARALA